MTEYLSRAGKTILIMITVVLSVAYVNNLADDKEPQIIYIQDPNYVQPPCEAQKRLKEQGLYHGKIDNIWGPESDRAFCDYIAIQEFKGERKVLKEERRLK